MARIALMLESDGPGGAEMILLHLAEALRERGHTICPVGPADGCGWLGGEFRKRGFTPRTFTLRRPIDWKCLRDLIRLLRDEEIDVVHSHEFTMAVYGAAAARRLGLPQVVTMHGGLNYGKRWRRRAALRWALRSSRAVAAVSRATKADLVEILGLPAETISVIHNGLPVERGNGAAARKRLGVEDREILMLSVGNLYPVKGHAVLIEALARLAGGEEVPWRLVIAGRGQEESRLRSLIAEHGLDGRIELLGFRSDVPDLLAASDIFVMPSLSEGLPLALVEAMLAEKAVVASNVGGVPEVVSGDGDAILVPPGEAGALAAALRRLFERGELRRSLGRTARRVAEAGFGVQAMTTAYEEAYGVQPSDRKSSRKRSTPVMR